MLVPQLCWDMSHSRAVFAPQGKAEKPAKAQYPSSSAKMRIYTKQGSPYSPHCSSVSLLKIKIRLFCSSHWNMVWPTSCLRSNGSQFSSTGMTQFWPFLQVIFSPSQSDLAPLLPRVPELAPPFFSLPLLELLQIDLDPPHLWQGVLTMSSAKCHPNSAISSLKAEDWVTFTPELLGLYSNPTSNLASTPRVAVKWREAIWFDVTPLLSKDINGHNQLDLRSIWNNYYCHLSCSNAASTFEKIPHFLHILFLVVPLLRLPLEVNSDKGHHCLRYNHILWPVSKVHRLHSGLLMALAAVLMQRQWGEQDSPSKAESELNSDT